MKHFQKYKEAAKPKFAENWDYDEMIEECGNIYLYDKATDWTDYAHDMDDLPIYLEGEDLWWLLDRLYNGGAYDENKFANNSRFDYSEDFFIVNTYGNFFSISNEYLSDFVKEKIEEMSDEKDFYKWCKYHKLLF